MKMVQATTEQPTSGLRSPKIWRDDQEHIEALVARLKHCEQVVEALTEAMPNADEMYGTPPQKWYDGMMEARVYWEVYDETSDLGFSLDSLSTDCHDRTSTTDRE